MRVVMTGATSGFGLEAARRLSATGEHDIVVGARDLEKARQLDGMKTVRFVPLDLQDLESARSFAQEVGKADMDALVLNAGLQLTAPEQAANAMEKTFVVNHLAHFLIAMLLSDKMQRGGRVLFTGSGTHDPAEKTPVPVPAHAKADLLAYPERDETLPRFKRVQSARAYSSSKLCNIMTALEMSRRYDDFDTMAFDPGFVPRTGLSRDYPQFVQALAGWLVPKLLADRDRTSTIDNSGELFARLITDPAYRGRSGAYWSVRGADLPEHTPSELARDEVAARALWKDSARLAGISQD